MKIGKYETHPIADAFPLLAGDEYKRFVADIKENGFLDDEAFTYRGALIDGRNRMRAHLELGIPLKVTELEDEIVDPISFVISRNLFRRQMNESQRAMVAARLATLRPGRQTCKAAGLKQAAAAAALNVGERNVAHARALLERAIPEIAIAVDRGDLTIAAATQLAELAPALQLEALEKALAPPTKRARSTTARQLARDAANEDQPDPVPQLLRTFTRAVQALGGTVKGRRNDGLTIALNGQVLELDIRREAAA